MLFFLILHYATLYFFVPLTVGGFLAWTGRDTQSRSTQVAGWTLVALGCWGAVQGVPYWHVMTTQKLEAGRYFESRCKEAVVQLPAAKTRADGLVWINPDAARATRLTGADEARDFVDPGRGRYRVIQHEIRNGAGVDELSWLGTSLPDNLATTYEHKDKASLPFELHSRSVTTDEDRRWGVEAAETTITDSATRGVVARRVVIASWSGSRAPGDDGPSASCPTGALKDARCGANGCSQIPFVLAAVAPNLPAEHAKIFHLYRGMGKKEASCSFAINIGPEISLDQLEWWGDGREGWEDLRLRIRGTPDELTCEALLGSGSSFRPLLKLADGPSFPGERLRDLFQKQRMVHSNPAPITQLR